MGFIVNTNTAAMISTTQANLNSKGLTSSLEKLSSGLKINRAADDASGLAIADSLRSQANSLKQALSNANDAVGIIQIADKAMEQQVKVLDTIKTKATQAAQDGQSTETRQAIQSDIKQLIEQLDNIAGNTSYNGKSLLSGNFVNKDFQVGAFSRNTIQATISATSSDKIGHVRSETTNTVATEGQTTLKFSGTNIPNGNMTIESVKIGYGAGEGLGVLTETINKNSNELGIRASFKVETVGSSAVKAGTVKDFKINGTEIGSSIPVEDNDKNGNLVAAINAKKDITGVIGSIDSRGHLNLTSTDGRGIKVESAAAPNSLSDVAGVANGFNGGRLTLTSLGATDIKVEETHANETLKTAITNSNQETLNLRGILSGFSNSQAQAIGAYANANSIGQSEGLTAGVTTLEGAMATMDIADSGIKQLDAIRSNLGSVQNQLQASVDNLSTAQVNIKSSESTLRDVDFAQESSNFSKLNILVQSGSYALSQANIAQQNVLRLLQ